jgi:N-acetylglucosaminyl-diphospho-decaprenol L-rhamnosyltransferase
MDLDHVRPPFVERRLQPCGERPAATVRRPRRDTSQEPERPAKSLQSVAARLARDLVDLHATFGDCAVDRKFARRTEAQKNDVVPLSEAKQELSRRLAAVARVEPRRERRANEHTTSSIHAGATGPPPVILGRVAADVSIVIASHNTREYLARCLAAFDGRYETIVVDNASTDASAELVRERFRHAHLVELEVNEGYGAALNAGLARASGRYLLLMNGDAWPLNDALEKLVSFAESVPDAGIIGPRLLNLDGTLQPSVRGFPTRWRLATEYFFLRWLAPRTELFNAFYGANFDHRSAREAEFLVGAVLLVRREALDVVGNFDTGFFMFNEEVDFCFRARAAGWKVVFWPGAEFTHVGGGSTVQVWPQMYREQLRSHLRFVAKHRGALEAERTRTLLAVAMMTRAAAFSVLGRSDRSRLSRDAAAWLRSDDARSLLDDG